ncbi:hypothetical protein OPV22_017177 [Ensete ventricosum]|uniref:Uncharacterized protein n=1 Tax=Ensete ventricosum TaxID=4639 RepID=A0AAV8R0C9_ENSVE|nr:hypothetical protein OPV22_017177 [Ensete ventricosum]
MCWLRCLHPRNNRKVGKLSHIFLLSDIFVVGNVGPTPRSTSTCPFPSARVHDSPLSGISADTSSSADSRYKLGDTSLFVVAEAGAGGFPARTVWRSCRMGDS